MANPPGLPITIHPVGKNENDRKAMLNKLNRFSFTTCSRSGHHAIINWLLHMCGKPSIWQDGVHAPPTSIYGRFTYGTQEKTTDGPWDTVCWSYENEPVQVMLDLEKAHPELTAPKRNVYGVVVRDLLNWWSSIGFLHGLNHQHFKDATGAWLEVWKEHMRFAMKGKQRVHDGVLVPINFNKWFVDLEYRRQIAADFMLEFDDSAKDEMHVSRTLWYYKATYYDKEAKNDPRYEEYEELKDKASKLGVLERWKLMQDNAEFQQQISNHKDALELSNEYFGDVRCQEACP